MYEKKSYSFRDDLKKCVINRRLDKSISFSCVSDYEASDIPKNLGSLVKPKPTKEDAMATYSSPFSC